MPGPRSVISEYLPPPCGPCRYVVFRDKPVHKLMVKTGGLVHGSSDKRDRNSRYSES